MKFFLALITVFSMSAVQASYFATHCSSSDAKVRWETGHNSNTLFLKFIDQEEQEKKIPYYDLEVVFTSEVVLRDVHVQNCGYSSHTKVFAAKALITPSAEKPHALDFLGEHKKIETEVICTTHVNGRSYCP